MSVLPEGSRVGVDPLIIPTGEWLGPLRPPGLLCNSLFAAGVWGIRDSIRLDVTIEGQLQKTCLGQAGKVVTFFIL